MKHATFMHASRRSKTLCREVRLFAGVSAKLPKAKRAMSSYRVATVYYVSGDAHVLILEILGTCNIHTYHSIICT